MMPRYPSRILIVDDEIKNHKLIGAILSHHGLHFASALNGPEALDLAAKIATDLILLDIMMPEMDGYEVCRRLKREEALAHIPVVMITALTDRNSRLKGLEAGASDFLTKPVDAVELIMRVRNLLKIKEYGDFLKDHNKRLEEEVARQTTALQKSLQTVTKAKEELEVAHARLLESEKLASLGLLAAGIVHEINNPLTCVIGNLEMLDVDLHTLNRYINRLETMASIAGPAPGPHAVSEGRRELKVDGIQNDLDGLVASALDGAARIKLISQNLRTFARRDEDESSMADINECLQRAIEIAWHEIKNVATVHREFGDLPPVRCSPPQLTQVFINLLVNAAQAIDRKGKIKVSTWHDGDAIHVAITDTGCGIPRKMLDRVFIPLFTTKEPGKGTGLGLSISHDIIKKHSGQMTVTSEVGQGTTFQVTLPVAATDLG